MRLLEAALGFDLFVRSGRGIDLTDRGRSFLYEAERVVGEVLGLADTAGRLRGAAVETFSVGDDSTNARTITVSGAGTSVSATSTTDAVTFSLGNVT